MRLEGLKSHKTRLAVLILNDEERTAIFVEGEGPNGRHDAAARVTLPPHPTFLSSTIPFSSCPQSFPALGSFQMSQFFTSGGQSIGVSASTSVLPMKIQDWFPLGWTGWVSSWNNVIKVGHKVQVRLACSMCGVVGSFDHPWLLLSSVIRCRQWRRDMECDLVPAHGQLPW